ncbi:MAG: hypothetical protein M3R13_10295 [Armatimonadota bacterium]|nr:hypothetical protein [Armatimonadota bacterium]
MTEIEAEAVGLRYLAKYPHAEGEPIPPEIEAQMLAEVRERAAAVEKAALDILHRETRNPPTRSGCYSRHMQFVVLKIFLPAGVILFVVLWLLSLLFK